MNIKEQAIADSLLTSVERAGGDNIWDAINVYQQFLNTVQTRLQIEAQAIKNKKQSA
jgi:hypothetical protein